MKIIQKKKWSCGIIKYSDLEQFVVDFIVYRTLISKKKMIKQYLRPS